jgi:hypothetical protein
MKQKLSEEIVFVFQFKFMKVFLKCVYLIECPK